MENLEPINSASPAADIQPTFPPFGPSNPPWGSLEAVGIWILSVALLLFIPAIFLLPYLASVDPPITDSQQLIEFAKTDPTAIFVQILAIFPAHLATLLVAWLAVTRMRKFSFRDTLGWSFGGFRWWHYVAVLVGFFLIASAVSRISPEQENDLTRMLQSSRSVVYLIAFVATFTAPLVEEVIYRGILYSAFQRTLGVSAAFILVTLLFAIVHVPQYWPSFSTIFLLALLSMMLTAIRVRTGNLLPCVILHTIFNGLQSVVLILNPEAPKLDVPTPVTTVLRLVGIF